ncbi:MAG: Alpha-galactosidase [Planctomycetes bacterium ADurb.Bin412]|nr:MAG: Alpha-galactosidase [Planctomycetes bacterium ADurb.Bin412]
MVQRILVTMAVILSGWSPVWAVSPTSQEREIARQWVRERLEAASDTLPFSFVYDGQPSREILKGWKLEKSQKRLDENRLSRTLVFQDPATALAVRCESVEYTDYPIVEWTVYFKNEGSQDSPILENIQALDLTLSRTTEDEFILHYFNGGGGGPDGYQPNVSILTAGKQETLRGLNGRPTGRTMSYFNLEWSGQGMLIAVGWPGQWAAGFTRDQNTGLQIRAGQEQTHCKLLPGEEIRTPLAVLQFWQGGNWIRSQNIWRRWMLAYNLPRPGGKLPAPQLAGGIAGYSGLALMFNSREEDHIAFLDRYGKESIPLDYWWMDLGWFILPRSYQKVVGLNDEHEYPLEDLGTYTADYHRFPKGIRGISDYCHARGIKTILWFDPEHIFTGCWQEVKHPEWMLLPPNIPGIEKQINQGLPLENRRVLNVGNPQALDWLNNRIAEVLDKEAIDTYRLDFNIEPLIFWQASDTEDRQGITENHYIQGFLAHLDDQLRRRPDLLIDNCASGGMRNDLETMRRSVPLWRSDYAAEPVGMQGMTYGIAFWLPYFGHWGGHPDPYTFRSNMMPAMIMGYDLRNAVDFDYLRQMIGQWRQVAPYYLGDYYPLSPHSLENQAWIAWQFNQPETGEGMVQAFRRQNSIYLGSQFKLSGLDPAARYTLQNLDTPDKTILTGQELMEKGLNVIIEEQPGAVILVYKKIG